MSPSDFILMEPPEAGGVSGGNWSDQETLLLLEAIELFRDNWSEIAEHVATKTKAQCILHFVQMPIEDAFFNHDDKKNDAPKENGVQDSISTKNAAPKADQDSDTALKDVPEKMESQGCTTDNQDSLCPTEISKADEVNISNTSLEAGESFALKALKEAFEAVGSLPSPGERLSFAEAGNPVMTLVCRFSFLYSTMSSISFFLPSIFAEEKFLTTKLKIKFTAMRMKTLRLVSVHIQPNSFLCFRQHS